MSLLAHSLGSVLTWDILTAQPRLYHSLAAHHGDGRLAALEALSRGSSPPGRSHPGDAWGQRDSQVHLPHAALFRAERLHAIHAGLMVHVPHAAFGRLNDKSLNPGTVSCACRVTEVWPATSSQ